MKRYSNILLLCILLLTACTSETGNQPVTGNWQGVSWKVQGQESGRNAADVQFKFNSDDTYTAIFGQQQESGIYRLKGNKLYTTAEGQAEKMVQVEQKGADTLVMDMNRVGTLEQLVLVRKQ